MNKKLDLNSKVKDVYEHPIGHDIIYKLMLQLNIKKKMILNPIIGNLSLKTVALLTKKRLGTSFMYTLLELLNSEQDTPVKYEGEITNTWWKKAVFYQIYPRSFQDSNNDGIGDIQGIITRLDYLKELGIDAIWLSPIYDSPNDDNGYDIRDYYSIMKEFGIMEDFNQLLKEVHGRGMKLIMDLVINHTSDEHTWFQAAIKDINSKYHDYYHFKTSSEGNPPNNWTSFFSGSAWNYYDRTKDWALHLFSKKQMDLNWENPEVRAEIIKMIRWWLEKGVDGFRLDVINYISKKEGLPDGNEMIGKIMGYYGAEHYFYGPKLHDYLKELKKEAFEPYKAFTVGETPGVGIEMSRLLTGEERKELDMVFSFDQLENPGHVRFEDYRYDLNYLKEYMSYWMNYYGDNCWMSLFYENHDNPRMISKVNPDPHYREVLAKLLAMIQLTLKGTPFIYQGQEIGAVNQNFRSIDDLRDVESINLFRELKPRLGDIDAMKKVMSGSRDHSRTPMQWDQSSNAGFTKGTPWITTGEDYKKWNVHQQKHEMDSIYHFYRNLIQLRKEHQALIYGDYEVIDLQRKDYYAYYRTLGKDRFLIECNLGTQSITRKHREGHKLLYSNYKEKSGLLRAYEANIYFCVSVDE